MIKIQGGGADNRRNPKQKEHWADIAKKDGITLMTYDIVINRYRENLIVEKNVLSYAQEGYRYKFLTCDPGNIFVWLGPDHLHLNRNQEEWLKSQGYDIDAWNAGGMLTQNHKRPADPHDSVAEMIKSIKSSNKDK
ncbi:MAG: hypothetical protein HRU20_30985 [Pseudomonadales bacterium]|nr:hypothetical protein [Pseudomonadales bacterium]